MKLATVRTYGGTVSALSKSWGEYSRQLARQETLIGSVCAYCYEPFTLIRDLNRVTGEIRTFLNRQGDHVLAEANGGCTTAHNIVFTCRDCNGLKKDFRTAESVIAQRVNETVPSTEDRNTEYARRLSVIRELIGEGCTHAYDDTQCRGKRSYFARAYQRNDEYTIKLLTAIEADYGSEYLLALPYVRQNPSIALDWLAEQWATADRIVRDATAYRDRFRPR